MTRWGLARGLYVSHFRPISAMSSVGVPSPRSVTMLVSMSPSDELLRLTAVWSLAVEGGLPDLLAPALHPARTSPTSTGHHDNRKGDQSGAVGAGAHPGIPGLRPRPQSVSKPQAP